MSLAATIQQLTEAHGSLYHVTTIEAFWKMLTDDQFELSYGRGDAESELSRYPFFLSTSRVPINNYRQHGSAVTLILDGQKLRQKYRVVPIDYWRAGAKGSEAEDRVVSNQPTIPKFREYLQEVHVLFTPGTRQAPYRNLEWYDSLPVFVYRDRASYFLLDKRKSQTVPEFLASLPPDENPQLHHHTPSERDLIKMDELLAFLEGGGQKRIKPWYDRMRYYPHDFTTIMGADVHNLRSKKGMAIRQMWKRWETLLRKYEAQNIRQFAGKFLVAHNGR